jgi:hypothetical protein
VWVKGGGGRPLHLSVDGREVGAPNQINTPGQWLYGGTVRLTAGSHEVTLDRHGRGFSPGDGINGPIGGIALERIESEQIVTVPPKRAVQTLCGRPWDWIEVVR